MHEHTNTFRAKNSDWVGCIFQQGNPEINRDVLGGWWLILLHNTFSLSHKQLLYSHRLDNLLRGEKGRVQCAVLYILCGAD